VVVRTGSQTGDANDPQTGQQRLVEALQIRVERMYAQWQQASLTDNANVSDYSTANSVAQVLFWVAPNAGHGC
jgi:hypothetical protein